MESPVRTPSFTMCSALSPSAPGSTRNSRTARQELLSEQRRARRPPLNPPSCSKLSYTLLAAFDCLLERTRQPALQVRDSSPAVVR